ncbi:MAG: hypothetical protein WBH75_16145 [Thermoanaerobaculia bacterium]
MKALTISLAIVLPSILAAGGNFPIEAQEFEHITEDAEPLRSQFNADVGKVRAVFLASPT